MESLDENIKSKMGFFKYVFNFNDDSKAEILNIIQYALIALVPVVILNKSMQKFIPEADELKGSIEISAEIIGQVLGTFLGLLLISRIITYIPTYSGEKYPEFSVIYIILAILMITLSLQTKLGEKVSILFDRVADLWDGGEKASAKPKSKGGAVRIRQPFSGQQQYQPQQQNQQQNQQSQQMAMNQSLNPSSNTTSIDSLPMNSQDVQQLPDYNSMYKNQNNPLVDAHTPSAEGMNGGIMAANEVLGGSFGSNF